MLSILSLAVISQTDVVLFSLAILAIFLLIVAAFIANIWIQKYQQGKSPYSGLPLRRAEDLSYASKEKILRYLYNLHQYDNRIFTFKNASFCRETGRIFTNSITWYGAVKVDWNFLVKRCPGNYVSWGSLNDSQQDAIRALHESLEGFQIDFSSSNASPRTIEPDYAFTKPGPLYVDLDTKILLGWKIIPDMDFEVLIVQHPKKQNKYENFKS